jgi:hypothetical protein
MAIRSSCLSTISMKMNSEGFARSDNDLRFGRFATDDAR